MAADDRPWDRVVSLLEDGQPLESVLSGWQLKEDRSSFWFSPQPNRVSVGS